MADHAAQPEVGARRRVIEDGHAAGENQIEAVAGLVLAKQEIPRFEFEHLEIGHQAGEQPVVADLAAEPFVGRAQDLFPADMGGEQLVLAPFERSIEVGEGADQAIVAAFQKTTEAEQPLDRLGQFGHRDDEIFPFRLMA